MIVIIRGPTAAGADSLPGPEPGTMLVRIDIGLIAQDRKHVCCQLDQKQRLQMVEANRTKINFIMAGPGNLGTTNLLLMPIQ